MRLLIIIRTVIVYYYYYLTLFCLLQSCRIANANQSTTSATWTTTATTTTTTSHHQRKQNEAAISMIPHSSSFQEQSTIVESSLRRIKSVPTTLQACCMHMINITNDNIKRTVNNFSDCKNPPQYCRAQQTYNNNNKNYYYQTFPRGGGRGRTTGTGKTTKHIKESKGNFRNIQPADKELITTSPAWVDGLKNSLASAMAAACSKLILAPFDTIKTVQQHSRSSSHALTLLEATKIIVSRPRGIWELYAGVGIAVVGSMPSVGLYFGVYSYCKKTFTSLGDNNSNLTARQRMVRRTMGIALAAAIGNTIASASRVPYEVLKQKIQTQTYASIGEALKDVSFRTLFPTGGIAIQMLRDVPYAIVTLLTYEYLKLNVRPKCEIKFPTVPSKAWDLIVGGISGGFGSYVTNPMDVLKTRLQTSSELYNGSIRTCAIQTWQEGGLNAFLRGSVPRLCHKVPANAFFFLFYETFRALLKVDDDASTTTRPKTS